MSPCLDNKGEIGADQDTVPELKEYITQFPARVITWSTRMEAG